MSRSLRPSLRCFGTRVLLSRAVDFRFRLECRYATERSRGGYRADTKRVDDVFESCFDGGNRS